MFARVELEEPRKALEDAGADVEVVSIEDGEIRGFDHFDPANTVQVDHTVEEVSPADYDALLVPGGVGNPDQLRGDENAVSFVRGFHEAGKPMAVICHGPWVLVESSRARGRHSRRSRPWRRTSATPVGMDRCGGRRRQHRLSRKPEDIPAFNREMLRSSPASACQPEQVRGAADARTEEGPGGRSGHLERADRQE
jgi:protease I